MCPVSFSLFCRRFRRADRPAPLPEQVDFITSAGERQIPFPRKKPAARRILFILCYSSLTSTVSLRQHQCIVRADKLDIRVILDYNIYTIKVFRAFCPKGVCRLWAFGRSGSEQTMLPKPMQETARLSVFEKDNGCIEKEAVRIGVRYPAMVFARFDSLTNHDGFCFFRRRCCEACQHRQRHIFLFIPCLQYRNSRIRQA